MKYSTWIGICACLLLAVSCYLPWTYYADIDKTFTGLFSQNNAYGRPGKFLLFFAIASGILIALPRIWAKRIHLVLSAMFTGYAVKTYILFSSCYNTFCPEKKLGIYLMLFSCFMILIVAIVPDIKLPAEKKDSVNFS